MVAALAANSRGEDSTTVSNATLARALGRSTRAVSRSLARLMEAGWIKVSFYRFERHSRRQIEFQWATIRPEPEESGPEPTLIERKARYLGVKVLQLDTGVMADPGDGVQPRHGRLPGREK